MALCTLQPTVYGSVKVVEKGVSGVFRGSNSNKSISRELMLESMRPRARLGLASVTLMGLSAMAAAGAVWLVGPLLARVQGQLLSESSRAAEGHIEASTGLSWAQIAVVLVGLGMIRALSEAGSAHVAARFQFGVIREFRGKILARVLSLEPAALAMWPAGELASRVQVEIHGVRSLLHWGVIQGIRGILMAIALATVAIQVDSRLATPGLILLPIAVFAVFVVARPARRFHRAIAAAESALVADTTELVDGAATLRAYAGTQSAWNRVDAAARDAEAKAVAADTWAAGLGPVVELAAAVAIGAASLFAWLLEGGRDLPQTATVLVALLLMYRPLHSVGRATAGFFAGLAALDRLDEALAEPTAPGFGASVRRALRSGVAVNRLAFGYAGHGAVLDGVSFELRAGEWVAVRGPSGAGKSTLLALLAGLLPASEGGIRLDGDRASRTELAEAVSWMSQVPPVFRGTVLDNVALGEAHPDRDRVIDAARRAGAHDFISVRPGGYEGRLAEHGADLSVGQRQRLALARALYRGAPLLLLDEPTSALSETDEQWVAELCREHAQGGGVVVMATHREALVRQADRVLEVRNGKVEEWGPPVARLHLH